MSGVYCMGPLAVHDSVLNPSSLADKKGASVIRRHNRAESAALT